MEYFIRPSEPKDVTALDDNLRANDRLELTCMGMMTKRIIWRSYRMSILRKTALVDGKLACMYGCAGTFLGNEGRPWLLTTQAIEKAPLAMMREARKEVRAMLEYFPVLHGGVLASYTQACRFLQLLGFSLGEPFEYGPDRALFRQYRMERG